MKFEGGVDSIKKITKTITREYNEEGKLIKETEVITEEYDDYKYLTKKIFPDTDDDTLKSIGVEPFRAILCKTDEVIEENQ